MASSIIRLALGGILWTAGATWAQGPLEGFTDPQVISAISHPEGSDTEPIVVTDGVGTWITVWEYAVDYSETETDILYSVSTNAGVSWSNSAPLNSNAGTDFGNDFEPTLATDGAGTWIAAWHSTNNLGGAIGWDYDIHYAISADNGASWSDPAPLNGNADTDVEHDGYATLAADGAGNWIAAWHSYDDLGETIGTDIDILCTVSTDNGTSWSMPAPLNSNAEADLGVDRYPALTTNGLGAWIVVWESTDTLGGTIGTDADILYASSMDNGTSWSETAPLNSNAASDDDAEDWLPTLSADNAGTWIAAWGATYDRDDGDGGVVCAVSTNDGDSWSSVRQISGATAAPLERRCNVTLAMDGSGTWIAAWESEDEGILGWWEYDIYYAVSTDNGDSWSAVAPLNSNAPDDLSTDRQPTLTTDGAGTWITTWDSDDDLDFTILSRNILYAVSTDNGESWSSATALNSGVRSNQGNDYSATLATDGSGTWIGAWHSDDSLGGALGYDDDILCAISMDNGETWSNPTPLNSDAAEDESAETDRSPVLMTDRVGTWVAAWHAYDGNDRDIRYAVSTDAGDSWSPAAYLNSNADTDAKHDDFPSLAMDGAGTWIAAWGTWDFDTGASDILFAVSADNGSSWSAAATLHSEGPGGNARPAVATDGEGTWIAAWHSSNSLGDEIGEDNDILYAVSRDDGASWSGASPLDGNASTDTGDDMRPTLTVGNTGAWIATWCSFDSLEGGLGEDGDILCAVSTDSGDSWSAPTPIDSRAATDTGRDDYPTLTTDGSGNWIVAWYSYDSMDGSIGDDTDILYAVSTDSGASWSPVAQLNSNAATDSGYDLAPALTTDGTGSWVALWASNDDLQGTTGGLGEIFCATLAWDGGEGELAWHTGDVDQDQRIGLSELLRMVQFYNSGDYHCDALGEDGYGPGPGDEDCPHHDADYDGADWQISLGEILRLVQFFNAGGYYVCAIGEDGFCPGGA